MINMKIHFKIYDTRVKLASNGTVSVREYKEKIISDLQKNEKSLQKKGRQSASDIIKKMEKSKATSDSLTRIRVDSLTRSRNLLIDYACENEHCFSSFLTLTFRDNINDLTTANAKFNDWTKKVRKSMAKSGYDFMYLGVPEFQKNGRVHYHLLTNIKVGSFWCGRQVGKYDMYDVKYWSHGFSSAFDIKTGTNDNFNIALYITKYLYKDFDTRLYGRNRVLKSNNLAKPKEIRLLRETSITYQNAIQYIQNKKYQVKDFYSFTQPPTDDNLYMIPFDDFKFKLVQEDYNTVKSIFQN